ncbi:MAG: hypothetical protein U5K56_00820 [Halioglobus sp.]|nr:hypothetical protein [Halioglobus sp.]
MASDSHRFYLLGSRDDGEDYESARGTVCSDGLPPATPGGWVTDSTHAATTNWTWTGGDWRRTIRGRLPCRWISTGFDTDLWNLRYTTRIGDTGLEFRLYGSEIDHGMSNFLLRPAPDFSALPLPPVSGGRQALCPGLERGAGFKASLNSPLGAGHIPGRHRGQVRRTTT